MSINRNEDWTNFNFKIIPAIINSTRPLSLGSVEIGRIKFNCSSNATTRRIHFNIKVKTERCWSSEGFGMFKLDFNLKEEDEIKNYIRNKLEEWCSNDRFMIVENLLTKDFALKTKVVDFKDLMKGIYREKII